MKKRATVELGAIALIGVTLFVAPVALDPERTRYESAFLPFVREAVEGVNAVSLGLLFLFGFVIGALGRVRVWIAAPASMVLLPVWSFIDLVLGGGHNLLGIEWAIYFLYALIPLPGAAFVRWLRDRRAASRGSDSDRQPVD